MALSTPRLGFPQLAPGDTAGINYPGWESADQVAPLITAETSYDSSTGIWTYSYTVSNQITARQGIYIIDFDVRMVAVPTILQASAPTGWGAIVTPYMTGGGIGGVRFHALFANDSLGPASGPPPALIVPGGSLSGFVVTSPAAPGQAHTFVQGYVELPPMDDAVNASLPADTANAQRGVAVFPNQVFETSGSTTPYRSFVAVSSLDALAVAEPEQRLLTDDGESDLSRERQRFVGIFDRTRGAGDDRDADLDHRRARGRLVAHLPDLLQSP